MKLVYPACFYTEENGQYSVVFPDLNNIATYGNDLSDAIDMATDLASGWLLSMVEEKRVLPTPSNIKEVTPENGGFVSLITLDLTEYEKNNGLKAVKKTLTIPAWMNTIAERQNVNFSALLQDAIKRELGL